MCQNRSRLFFRNKYTTTRLRSPINKHLSKIIVFTIRQRKIIRPKTARINIICILHPFHVQNHNYVNNTPIVLQPSSIAEKDSKHNNRPKKCTYPQVENITILPEHLFSLKKTTSRLLKRQRLCSIRIGHIFHGSFRWFFTIKNHLRADDYATTVCAMKSTQLKQGRTTRRVFLNTRTYPSLFRKRFNFLVIRKATFRTQKRFQNKQYTPKLKDQPFESERTHFDTWFNNGSIAMHRPTIIFLLSHKITTVQQKTTNRNNQSNQTIRKNNPRNHSIKNIQRQTQQAITTKCNVFEYYNIANSNGFRANRKYAFYKNSTQIHKTAGATTVWNKVQQPRKSIILYF